MCKEGLLLSPGCWDRNVLMSRGDGALCMRTELGANSHCIFYRLLQAPSRIALCWCMYMYLCSFQADWTLFENFPSTGDKLNDGHPGWDLLEHCICTAYTFWDNRNKNSMLRVWTRVGLEGLSFRIINGLTQMPKCIYGLEECLMWKAVHL